MITYGDIYEASRKERYSEQLQPLLKNFVLEVANYLREKREIASKEDENFSDIILKTKKQLENAVTLFKELMIRRRKKILNLVLIAAETGISKQDFENMLDFEKELFEDLMKGIDSVDKKINGLLNGKSDAEIKNELIVFLDNVEELLDGEGEMIGPFEKGQVANISKDVAKILVEAGKVEILQR